MSFSPVFFAANTPSKLRLDKEEILYRMELWLSENDLGDLPRGMRDVSEGDLEIAFTEQIESGFIMDESALEDFFELGCEADCWNSFTLEDVL